MYILNLPQKICFGVGGLQSLPEYLTGQSRIFLLSCGRKNREKLFSTLFTLLENFHVTHEILSGEEPTLELTDKFLAAARKTRPDVVIAVGGGAVIDAAKTVAILLSLPGSTADYFYNRRKLSQCGTKLICIPTTAGTGAEVTANAVLSDPATNIKQSLRHPSMQPTVAIVDPELTLSCPPSITAASGMDSLTQAIESLIAQKANHFTKPLSRQAAELVYKNLPAVIADGNNLPARTALSEGTLLGAMAFAHSGLGAVHGLAHPIGCLRHIPHGVVCAKLLPEILQWNYTVSSGELEKLAVQLGEKDFAALHQNLLKFNQDFGINDRFRSAGLTREDFPFIIAHSRSGSMKANPRDLSDNDLYTILESLL